MKFIARAQEVNMNNRKWSPPPLLGTQYILHPGPPTLQGKLSVNQAEVPVSAIREELPPEGEYRDVSTFI
jgi:hypothetical protein